MVPIPQRTPVCAQPNYGEEQEPPTHGERRVWDPEMRAGYPQNIYMYVYIPALTAICLES